jgi:MinD-like ATPase involved in chromosome partitioning or flagellar assembly
MDNYQPAGRLVPVFRAHEDLSTTTLALDLAKAAAARGETTLMLDIDDGALMDAAGIIVGKTLGDVLYRKADIADAKYISHNEHFTAACAGDATLDALLGSLAALSLRYDWVFVSVDAGCTPAHVRLAAAADSALLAYSSQSDRFMRAYWMLDAIRARSPKFDPLMIVEGPETDAFETFDMLAGTVREFLGAPPSLGGILERTGDGQSLAPTLLESLRAETVRPKRAVS